MPSVQDIAVLTLLCVLLAILSWAAVAAVRPILIRYRVVDAPNARSSHSAPKPRGAGLALLAVAFPAWAASALVLDAPGGTWTVLALALVLAAASFVDDLRGLPALPRFAMQGVAVTLGIAVFDAGPVFQGVLPPWLDGLMAGLLWLWFVNLFNFMDGIDGITGVETISLGLGLALIAPLAGFSAGQVFPGLALASAAAGFLVWNWAPSKVFLGDVGSVALGYLLGWLLLLAAADGQWVAALILPAYYLADATLTLLARLLRGEKIWQAHKQHAYQRAVQRGWSHARTAGWIAAGNSLLIVCALAAAAGLPWTALAMAVIVVVAMLWAFRYSALPVRQE
jgi:UDP-N-acetylmuramyl pentapeptide phosphotransferase/UDP-N-acetylglucosamine-1-phosphate transferase